MKPSKYGTYHINKVLNKWEEENYKKLMARKITGARSTLNTGSAKGGSKGTRVIFSPPVPAA